MGLTKIGSLIKMGKTEPIPKNPYIKLPGWASKWGDLESKSLGPISVGLNGYQVYTGDTSLGGAVAGTAAASATYKAADKYLDKHVKGGINTLVSKIPKNNILKSVTSKLPKNGLLSKVVNKIPGIPGRLASLAVFAGSMYASGKVWDAGNSFGNKFAPIYKRDVPTDLPRKLTPEQIIKYKQIVQRAGHNLSGVPDLDTFQDIVTA